MKGAPPPCSCAVCPVTPNHHPRQAYCTTALRHPAPARRGPDCTHPRPRAPNSRMHAVSRRLHMLPSACSLVAATAAPRQGSVSSARSLPTGCAAPSQLAQHHRSGWNWAAFRQRRSKSTRRLPSRVRSRGHRRPGPTSNFPLSSRRSLCLWQLDVAARHGCLIDEAPAPRGEARSPHR